MLSAELVEDGAVGAIIAFACLYKAAQRVNYASMCFHAGYDPLLMALGKGANLAALASLVAPEIKELVDLLNRKAQGSSAVDEA